MTDFLSGWQQKKAGTIVPALLIALKMMLLTSTGSSSL
jgi:hypothetical protein